MKFERPSNENNKPDPLEKTSNETNPNPEEDPILKALREEAEREKRGGSTPRPGALDKDAEREFQEDNNMEENTAA